MGHTVDCVDTPAGGRFIHPVEDRTLTPREAARIQSFPVTIVGLILGICGIKKGGKGMAIAGIVCCAITLILTIINSVLGAYLGATGQLF